MMEEKKAKKEKERDVLCEILLTLRAAFRDLRALSFALAW